MRIRGLLRLLLLSCFFLTAPVVHADSVVTASALPPPVVPHCFGVNIHFTGAPNQDLDGLTKGGFGWVRMDFAWDSIEKTKGVYDFSDYDTLVVGLAKRHIQPLFILDYGNALYQDGSPRSPEARAAFVRFAVAGIKHFQGQPILWEIWNEPNGGFWQPKPDAQEYGTLAVETAKAIKQADPKATVIAPGTSTIPLPYLETCFKLGLLRWIDAVSVHPYRSDAPETAATEYQNLRALIHRYAPAGKAVPLISSEWGYSTTNVSEQIQSKYLARQWLSNLAQGIALSIWYDWHDDGTDPKNGEHNFGTVHNDYSPKPAFVAARTLLQSLQGYHFVKRIPLASQDDYLLLFAQGNASLALALWTTGKDHALTLPLSGSMRVLSMLGKKSVVNPAKDLLHVTVSDSPQYLFAAPADNPDLMRAAHWNVVSETPFYKGGDSLKLRLNYTNTDTKPHRVRFLIELSLPGADGASVLPDGENIVAPGKSLSQEVTSSRYTRVPVQARTALVVDSVRQSYPQDLLFTPTDPLMLSIAPTAPGTGFLLEAINPQGTAFSGVLELKHGTKVQHISLRLKAGQTDFTMTVPGDVTQPTRATLYDLRAVPIAFLPERRFVPYPVTVSTLNTTFEGDPNKQSIVKATTDGDTLHLRYQFGPGWTFLRSGETQPSQITAQPDAYGLWVYGDASGNMVRMRFTDSTGQTFQPDGGFLDFQGWRYITFPFTSNIGHWGGANDGTIHFPIHLESLFLLDSVHEGKKHQGTVAIARPSLIYKWRHAIMGISQSRSLVVTNIANLYAEPSTSSELVTQALMGMEVSVEEENETWRYVQMEDRYRGWMRAARLTQIWDDRDYLKTTVAALLADVYSKPDGQSEMLTKLAVSTRVSLAHRPEVGSYVPILLADKTLGYVHKSCLNLAYETDNSSELADPQTRRSLDIGQLKQRVIAAVGRQAVETGKRFIGTPYLWGGSSPFGIDCSGFVQLMYKLNGIQLLRDADIQFTDRRFVRVEKEQTLATGDFSPGDLIVFGNTDSGKVTHIGLAMGEGRFIHSSGSRGVAIDPCDNPTYVKTYLGAARISPEAELSINAA